MLKTIIFYFIFISTLLFSNQEVERAQIERISEIVFQKFFENMNEMRTAYRDSSNAFLMDAMTGIASSAPRENFIMNVDLVDTVIASEVEMMTFISLDNQNTWNNFSGYSLNDALGYDNTWESIGSGYGDNVNWYMTGSVESEILFGQAEWGRLLFTQMPEYLPGNENQLPIPVNYLGTLAYDYTEPLDSIPLAYDIKDLSGAYGDNKIFFKIEYGDECCEFGPLFGPWYFYLIGVTNPISPEGDSYGFFHCFALSGLYHIGMIKLTGDSGEIIYLDNVDYDFAYNGNALEVYFSLDNLITDEGFGPWPNNSNSLIGLTNTFGGVLDFEDIDNSQIEEYDLMRTTILLNSQSQQGNQSPVISNPLVDLDLNQINVTYQDDDGNFAVYKSVQVCAVDATCDCGIIDGDLNDDSVVNILDIVGMVSNVLGNSSVTDEQFCSIDTDANSIVNILDIVKVVSVVMNTSHFEEMFPLSHTYLDGVQYQMGYDFSTLSSGEYKAVFLFSDDSKDLIINNQIIFSITE